MPISTVRELLDDIKFGWNHGNSFDCSYHFAGTTLDRSNPYNLARNAPTSWGNPAPSTIVFDAMKNNGVNAIRLPVTWDDHSDQTTFLIDQEWFDYLDPFITHIVDTLDMYCLLSPMCDGSYWWNTTNIIADPAVMARFKYMWQQVATHYAGYSKKLIFGAWNETLNLPFANPSAIWDTADATMMGNLNTVGAEFVSTVRAIAGNEDRFLCLPSYAAKVYAFPSLILPDNKCFGEVHIYTSDIPVVKSYIDTCYATGKPFIVGEFGTTKGYYDIPSAVSNLAFLVAYAKSKGAPSFIWDDNGNMQFFNRYNAIITNDTSDANFNGNLTADSINMFVQSGTIKEVNLFTSSRKNQIRIDETIDVYPEMPLNRYFHTFSSDPLVASFNSVYKGKLTGAANGTTVIDVFGTYGNHAQATIEVGETSFYNSNTKVCLQDFSNWNASVYRTIDAFPSAEYTIKCPSGYKIDIEEYSQGDAIMLKKTTLTSDSTITTSIATKRIKFIVSGISGISSSNLRSAFNRNDIDMTIRYSKYTDESAININEEGAYVPKIAIKTGKVAISGGNSNAIKCTNIITNPSYVVEIGNTIDISEYVSVTPIGTTQVIEYNSEDATKAEIDLNGVITPISPCLTQIHVRCGDVVYSPELEIKGIVISNKKITIQKGVYTASLSATAYPDMGTTWTTSDSLIATVENGVITPVSNGTVTITATNGDYSTTCLVVIKSFTVNFLSISSWSAPASTSYAAFASNYLKTGKTIVAGKQYKISCDLAYNVRAYDSSHPAVVKLRLGSFANYHVLYNASIASNVTPSSYSSHITYTVTAPSNITDSTDSWLRVLLEIYHEYVVGTYTLTNLIIEEL